MLDFLFLRRRSTMGGVQSQPLGRRGVRSPPQIPLSFFTPGLLLRTRCDDTITTKDSSAPPPPPLPGDAQQQKSASAAAPPAPPTPEGGGGESDSITTAAAIASAYTNPGTYEQVAADGKRLIMLETFGGFKFDINKQISPYMAAVHSFLLGTNLPDGRKSSYTFLTQIGDESGLKMARVDLGRMSVDGRIHRALLGGAAMAKLQFNVSADGQADQCLAEVDFGAQTWMANLKYGSMGGGIVYGCNYIQAITPKLAMGGEGMYIAANQNLISSYMLRYTIPAQTGDEGTPAPVVVKQPQLPPGMPPPETEGSSTICANYNTGQSAVTLNYKRVITPNRVTVGAELQFSPLSLESQLLFGAEFKLQRSKINVAVDSSLRIQSTLEAKLGMAPGSPSLNFSAEMDHWNDEMKFGYGVNVEG